MRLWIVRHAHAVDARGPTAADDAARPLSARGRADTRAMGRFLRDADDLRRARACWHSGLLRARETAELFVAAVKSKARIRIAPGLAPDDAPATLAQMLEEWSGGDVIVVGHEPHLSAFASLLVTGRREPVVFALKKGAVVALERVPGRHRNGRRRWLLRWHLTPGLIGA